MANDDFPDFELIPDLALNLSPDQEAALYVDPDDLPMDVDEVAREPLGRTVWMDWGSGRLYQDRWVSGPDAVVMVAQVALNVVRGANPLFPDWFGRSPDALIGQVDSSERRLLHQTDIRDTLLSCHERVTDVSGFRWATDPTGSVIDFEADVEIDGEVTVLVGGSVAA